jgi:cell division protein FtsA
MAKALILAAIELGSAKVSTLIAQVHTDPVSFESSVNIVGVSSVESRGVKKGQIVDIEEAVDVTVASVEAAERMAGYNLDSAYIAVGGAHVTSQNSHGVVAVSDPDTEVTPDDVERVIEAASAVSLPSSRELIHVIPREYIVDGEVGVKDPVGMSGIRLEVETHLVTASSAAIKNIKKAINEVGVNASDMVFSGFAAAEAVLTKTEKELGCVLIDIGGGTTSIAAYIEGSLSYSGVIPVGAKNVTNDLAIGLRVSLESAEKIKIALSETESKKKPVKYDKEADQLDLSALGVEENKKVSRKTLTEGIIKPRLNEIFTMVKLQMEKDNVIHRIPSGAILTGGGAMTVGVVDSAKRVLSIPTRLGIPKGLGGLIDDIMTPQYAVPVGLILYASRQQAQDHYGSITRKIKLPTKGLVGKMIESIKDLLP